MVSEMGFYYLIYCFLGSQVQHMGVPGQGVESELQPYIEAALLPLFGTAPV